MINSKQSVYFHLGRKNRHGNLTYNSSNVFGTLTSLGNQNEYTKELIKNTEYKQNFQKRESQKIVEPIYSTNHLRHNNPTNFLHHNNTKENILDDPIRNKSYLSSYGKSTLQKQ